MYFDLSSRINILISKVLSRRSSIVVWTANHDGPLEEFRNWDFTMMLHTSWRKILKLLSDVILLWFYSVILHLDRLDKRFGLYVGGGRCRWRRSDWGRNVIKIPVDLYHNYRVEVTKASSTERGREHVIAVGPEKESDYDGRCHCIMKLAACNTQAVSTANRLTQNPSYQWQFSLGGGGPSKLTSNPGGYTWPHLDDKVTGTGFNDLDDIDDKLVENVSCDFSGTEILWCPKTRFWSSSTFTIVMLAKFHVCPFQLQQHILFNQITVLKRKKYVTW